MGYFPGPRWGWDRLLTRAVRMDGGAGGLWVGVEGLDEFGGFGFEGVVVFPVGEVGNVVAADFVGEVFGEDIVPPVLLLDGVHGDEADGEEDAAAFGLFALQAFADFAADPVALHGVGGEDEQEAVVDLEGLVYLVLEVAATFDVFGGVPNLEVRGAEVSVEALGEGFVVVVVADEAGLELDWLVEEGGEVVDEVIG